MNIRNPAIAINLGTFRALQSELSYADELLRRLQDAVEALDGVSVESEKLVGDYRLYMERANHG